MKREKNSLADNLVIDRTNKNIVFREVIVKTKTIAADNFRDLSGENPKETKVLK